MRHTNIWSSTQNLTLRTEAVKILLTIPVSNVMYDFPQQIFGKLNGDRLWEKKKIHYVDNFN